MFVWAMQIVLAVVFGAAGMMKAGTVEGAARGQPAHEMDANGS